MKELVPELVCDLESGWNSFLSLGASDNDDDIANVAATSNTAKKIEENNCGETKTNVKNDASFKNKYYRPDDTNYEGDDLLLKRLTLYFQKEVMKWVNQPPCSNSSCVGNHDGKKMENRSMRGPVTEEEKRGGAGRVEGVFLAVVLLFVMRDYWLCYLFRFGYFTFHRTKLIFTNYCRFFPQ